MGEKKVVKLDDYRPPKVVGEWAVYESDGEGNPVGEPLEEGFLYDKDPYNFRTS